MLPLYRHDSLRSERVFRDEIELIAKKVLPAADSVALQRWASCSTTRDFIRGGMKFTGFPVELRDSDIRISTDNSFSVDFSPPNPRRAATALQVLLQHSSPRIRGASDSNGIIGAALSAYFIFLTIHPFKDGNGRTARFYFAACISRLETTSPIFLLALALMHRDRSSAFHLAAKAARIGSLDMLMETYSESIALASTLFSDEIDAISQRVAVHSNDPSDLLVILMRIRDRLRIYLLT